MMKISNLGRRILAGLTGLIVIAFILSACSKETNNSHSPKRQIALSFDDAPRGDGPQFTGIERTDALIDALDAANLPPSVFFVTTKGLATPEGRQRVTKYAAAGHLIANHSDQHQMASKIGLDAMMIDTVLAETKLESFKNRRSWYRFPYLDEGDTPELRDNIRKAFETHKLSNGYVTVCNFDWHIQNRWEDAVLANQSVDMEALKNVYVDMLVEAADFYDEVAIDVFGETVPHILLLHENDLAALFIGDVTNALRSEGWEIISPDKAYAHPIAKIKPKTLQARSGHLAALAIEAGRSPNSLSNRAVNEKELDLFLKERHVFASNP